MKAPQRTDAVSDLRMRLILVFGHYRRRGFVKFLSLSLFPHIAALFIFSDYACLQRAWLRAEEAEGRLQSKASSWREEDKGAVWGDWLGLNLFCFVEPFYLHVTHSFILITRKDLGKYQRLNDFNTYRVKGNVRILIVFFRFINWFISIWVFSSPLRARQFDKVRESHSEETAALQTAITALSAQVCLKL